MRLARGAAALLLAAGLASGACAARGAGKTSVPKGKDSALTIEQLFAKGEAYIQRRKYFRARATLEQIQGRPDATREMLADVTLLIADAYFFDGGIINLAEALSRYTSFLTFYPSHPKADYAQYQLGLSYLKQALAPDKDQATTLKALEAFREVERQHPSSDWAERAREQMQICREKLAESHMRVGLFYVKRGAWPGAIERFRAILEEYPLYSRLDRTYFELARALGATNRRDESMIYFQKMLEAFPDSRYAAEAREALGSGQQPPETAEAGAAGPSEGGR